MRQRCLPGTPTRRWPAEPVPNEAIVEEVSGQAVVVGSREQLLHLLAEAAEIEHTLMCSYLYAAFSLSSKCRCRSIIVSRLMVATGYRRQDLCPLEVVYTNPKPQNTAPI